MSWYDVFALTYDRQLERLYAPYRRQAVEALHAKPGETVLDLACGTGQSFAAIVEAVGPSGRLVGVDGSTGMLRQARRRVDSAGWRNVTLVHADATSLRESDLDVTQLDGVLIALGLTAMARWEEALARALALLPAGGRCVILDVHAERRGLQTRIVELLARADLSRRVWEPLEAASADFERIDTGAPARTFGGTLYVASGTKGAGVDVAG